MRRLACNLIVLLVIAAIGAALSAWGPYYDEFFGRASRNSWNTIENDTSAKMANRAKWGAIIGGGFTAIVLIRSEWRRAHGEPEDDDDGGSEKK